MKYLQDESFRFYVILLFAWVLIYIPYIGKYVRLISTMIHEGGHVLMGCLLGERTLKVSLFSNASGEAAVSVSNKFKKLLIAIAGYPSTALIAFLSFWLLSKDLHFYYIIGISLITLTFLLLYIRNIYGIVWSVSFIAINFIVLYFKYQTLLELMAQAYACIILLESVFSCFILVYVSFKSKTVSDASNVSSVVLLPKQLVALLFTAFNLYMAFISVTYYFPSINHFINQN